MLCSRETIEIVQIHRRFDVANLLETPLFLVQVDWTLGKIDHRGSLWIRFLGIENRRQMQIFPGELEGHCWKQLVFQKKTNCCCSPGWRRMIELKLHTSTPTEMSTFSGIFENAKRTTIKSWINTRWSLCIFTGNCAFAKVVYCSTFKGTFLAHDQGIPRASTDRSIDNCIMVSSHFIWAEEERESGKRAKVNGRTKVTDKLNLAHLKSSRRRGEGETYDDEKDVAK